MVVMDDAKQDPMVETVRAQQHTGNHETGVEHSAGEVPMAYVVTPDDAYEVGRDPESYAHALAEKLRPYGVTVRYAPDQSGRGGLIGVSDTKLEVDIRQAIAMVDTE
jgi:hypothetical protein